MASIAVILCDNGTHNRSMYERVTIQLAMQLHVKAYVHKCIINIIIIQLMTGVDYCG